MRLAMPTPATRDDSSLIQFRVKVPADVREKARVRMLLVELPAFGDEPAVTVTARIGEHVKFSLRTRDPAAAKVRHGAALVHVARAWDGFRSGPRPLSLREIVALGGDMYRLFIDECGDEPGDANNWIAVKGFNRAVAQGRVILAPTLRPLPHHANEIEIARDLFGVDITAGIDAHPAGAPSLDALEGRFGLLANWTLMRPAVEVGSEDRFRLLQAVERAVTDAAIVLTRLPWEAIHPSNNATKRVGEWVKAAGFPLSREV